MNIVKKTTYIFLLSFTTLSIESKVPHSIILTFNEYPVLEDTQELKASHNNPMVINSDRKGLQNIHTRHKKNIRKPLNLSGIPVIYYGYITYTQKDGIVMFPRMHENSYFYVLLSTKINPVFMLRNTIHHLEIAKNSSHSFYKISKQYDDQTKTHFWNVEKQTFPADGHIPLETITIFMEPENFYLPEGISITNDNAQAILPVMYIKNDKNFVNNSLASLEINYLFKTIDPLKKS